MEKNKTKIITIASLLALVILIIGATYAYFVAQTGEGSQTDIRINANTVDTLTFETGDPITLTLDQENFAQGTGNQTGSTFAKAMLTANNKTNTATENYYLYLNISDNTFTYTQNEDTPEILLTITDTNNNEITSINGLTYKTVTDGKGTSISGYDITNKSGLITIFENREITTTSSITEEWNVTVTYVNYNADQSANAGKSFSAKLIVQQNELVFLKDYVISQYTGTQGENSLYYHDSTLTNGAGDKSYRYAGGDYVLTELGISIGATSIVGYDDTETNTLIDFYCNGTKKYIGYYCSASNPKYYLIKNDTTEYQTYGEALKSAVVKGYLKDNNVKNFVCFGNNKKICPEENLYRIIGVIDDKVRLIKYDYATKNDLGEDGDYYKSETPWLSEYRGNLALIDQFSWNRSGSNTWSTSQLNKINLNTNFLDNMGNTWANKIVMTTWKVGGPKYWGGPATIYKNEILNPVTTNTTDNAPTYDAKVGLIYLSDYGFAAASDAWTLSISGYNNATVKNNNWMYMGYFEWTMTRKENYTNMVYLINASGEIYNNYNQNPFAIRPVFNLESSVAYVSGAGTQSDPIIIN